LPADCSVQDAGGAGVIFVAQDLEPAISLANTVAVRTAGPATMKSGAPIVTGSTLRVSRPSGGRRWRPLPVAAAASQPLKRSKAVSFCTNGSTSRR